MRYLNYFCVLMVFSLLLIGCTNKGNSALKIEPLTTTEYENTLIQNTGIDSIEYFSLDGYLDNGLDLIFTVELYENGQFKENLLTGSGQVQQKFNQEVISFGINRSTDSEQLLELLIGFPSGFVSGIHEINIQANSFQRLINEGITLEKDKPVYLSAWLGTNENSLHSLSSQNGDLPSGINEVEVAILYKITLTNMNH